MVASQPENTVRIKDLKVCSPRWLDGEENWWSVIIWEHEDACKISTRLDNPS